MYDMVRRFLIMIGQIPFIA